ncbi:hypothetical protein [Phaeodactylibacter sp.]|uniref:hypothetical protein n=1 Tax=Phaeodactylibacter sp. TaxID=1940289 RepID=UPI0025EE1A8A|nr:hypothetical protein [Phaeodactylibacter sp.]MCI5093482.1 hypothetical protein [Phaeodactylibacter sp.]
MELANSQIIKVNSATGRIIGTSGVNQTSYTYPHTGVEVSYKYEAMNVGGRRPERFISIGIHSKMLGERYLQGINSKSVHSLYSEIQRHGLIDVDALSLFDKSSCTDVDIKRDEILSPKALKAQISDLKKSVFGKRKHLVKTFRKADNLGIQFSERSTTSFKSAPFLKIYHKGIELMQESNLFASKHLAELIYEYIARIETTIKNRKHFKYLYGDDFNPSLSNVVCLTAEQQQKALETAKAVYIDSKNVAAKRKAMTDQVRNLKGVDKMLFAFLQNFIQDGKTIDEAVQFAVLEMYQGEDQVSRNYRTRYKKKLHDLYELIEGENSGEYCPVLDLFFDHEKRA